MRFKENVKVFGIKPEIVIILPIIDEVYNLIVGRGCTITSVTDGKHGKTSLHPFGFAIDIRTRDDNSGYQWRDGIKEELAKELRLRLTDEYDVVVEGSHIHIEYDNR